MTSKVLRALGLISMIVVGIIFLFDYANYPEQVLLTMDSNGDPLLYLSKNSTFYSFLGIMAIVNISLILLSQLVGRNRNLTKIYRPWIWSLAVLINVFFIISITFISILNSRENFNYSNFGYLIYVSLLLLFLWAIGLVIRLITVKINT